MQIDFKTKIIDFSINYNEDKFIFLDELLELSIYNLRNKSIKINLPKKKGFVTMKFLLKLDIILIIYEDSVFNLLIFKNV